MGLDTYLHRQEQKPEVEQVFDKLIGAEAEMEEVLYWRKNFNLIEWFRIRIGEIDNCKNHEIDKDVFVDWLEALETETLDYEEDDDKEVIRDMEMIEKILKETDFKKTKFFIYSWW